MDLLITNNNCSSFTSIMTELVGNAFFDRFYADIANDRSGYSAVLG